MPDPTYTDAEVARYTDPPVTYCPECGSSILGTGTLSHVDDEFHMWAPDRPQLDHRRDLALLLIALLAIGFITAWGLTR